LLKPTLHFRQKEREKAGPPKRRDEKEGEGSLPKKKRILFPSCEFLLIQGPSDPEQRGEALQEALGGEKRKAQLAES